MIREGFYSLVKYQCQKSGLQREKGRLCWGVTLQEWLVGTRLGSYDKRESIFFFKD